MLVERNITFYSNCEHHFVPIYGKAHVAYFAKDEVVGVSKMNRIKPSEGNKTFCMAPWTHTYLSPQMERRLCCSSRESSENFKQYIDTIDPKGHNDKINLTTLEQHWNSDYMKSVRLKLLAGEEIPQCAVCNHKLLNEQVYRQHFNWLYKNKVDEAFDSTDETGATTMQTESFDYRFSNLCNFSCRMCGDMLSSSWETENKKHGKGDYENYRIWGRKDIKAQLEKFHDQQIVKEFTQAVEEKRITELYWCGGEPLMWNMNLLTNALKAKNKKTHLETSGAYKISGIWDWFCLSPKKNKLPTEQAFSRADELKIIIYNKHDLEFAESCAKNVKKDCLLYLQPEWGKKEFVMSLVVKYIKQNPKWKISLQTHKYLDIP